MKPGARRTSDGFIGPRLILLRVQLGLHMHAGLRTLEYDQRTHNFIIADESRFVLDLRQSAPPVCSVAIALGAVRPEAEIVGRGVSIEGYADPLFPAPDDVAGQVQPVGLEDQREIVGDAHGAGYVERRSDVRHVANHAIDRAAAELDGSGLQDTMSREGPLFAHEGVLYAKFISKWLRKRKSYVVLRNFSGTCGLAERSNDLRKH
jgi:hypothetical protein